MPLFELDVALLQEAGFEAVELFYAGFTFKGWVTYAHTDVGQPDSSLKRDGSKFGRRMALTRHGGFAFKQAPSDREALVLCQRSAHSP